MTPSLKTIIAALGIGTYAASQWFSTARLVGSDLLVSDHDDANTIERCYIPEIQKRLGITLRVVRVTSAPPASAPTKFSDKASKVFKKKHWKELGIEAPRRDLLD